MTVHQVRVGELRCALVDDGELFVAPEVLFPRDRREIWPAFETNAEGHVRVPVICLLVWTSDGVVLVDAGNGSRPGARFPGGGLLVRSLAELGIAPEGIDRVVFTHGHTDHVGGTTYLENDRLRPVFPRARHIITRADFTHFTQTRKPTPPYVEQTLLPLHQWGLIDQVGADEDIAAGVQLIGAPGHTPGNAVVRVNSHGEALYFLGDLVHNVAEIENLHLIPDGDVQPDLVPLSRKTILDRVMAESAYVAASHLEWPALGHLTLADDRYRFVPD